MPIGQYAFSISSSPLSWIQAEAVADDLGAHLASVTSAEEHEFISDVLGTYDGLWRHEEFGNVLLGPWIGLTQAPGSAEPDGGWGWVNGEPYSFTAWRPGEPGGPPTEDSGHYYDFDDHSSIGWNDITGDTSFGPTSQIIEFAADAVALTGTAGVDYIYGGATGNFISAGAGEDVANGGDGGDQIRGGPGDDTLHGEDGDDTLFGGADNDTLVGGVGRDTLVGGAGNNRMEGGDDGDSLRGSAGIDTLFGNDGDDRLGGGAGNDRLYGDTGDDELAGGDGNDKLFGGDGDDRLLGDAGHDLLVGGAGSDRLNGGGNNDVFRFDRASETGVGAGNRDIISDFHHIEADKIGVKSIDADTTNAGDQAFAFVGSSAFTGVAGELRAQDVGSDTVVQGDTNGDAVADFEILLLGNAGSPLVGGDFLP
jgi:Ca2+-binding RTX toxin-like protein